MRLKTLTDFREEHCVPNRRGKLPDMRTLRKWPGVVKIGGEWYIDLDVFEANVRAESRIDDMIARLVQLDPVVAKAVAE